MLLLVDTVDLSDKYVYLQFFILVLWAENSRYIIACWSSRLVGCDDFFHALVRGDALCICLKSGPVLWSSPDSCFTFTEFYVSISTRKAAQPCCPRPVLYRLIGLYETLFDKWKKNVLRLIIFLGLGRCAISGCLHFIFRAHACSHQRACRFAARSWGRTSGLRGCPMMS